jgi:hypothetical protein
MTAVRNPKVMGSVFRMVLCPKHEWGATRATRVVEDDGSHFDTTSETCAHCGSHLVVMRDGSYLFPATATTPPSKRGNP